MKRCRQCDFIYEDDQALCDMDGGELVHDPAALALVESAAGRQTATPAKSRRRSLILPLAGLALGAALFPAYYVRTESPAPPDAGRPPAEVASVQPPPPAPSDAQDPEYIAPALAPSPVTFRLRTAAVDAPVSGATRGTPAVAKRTPKPPPASRPAAKRASPENASQKKESKLGSILKKTGRLLKKPFKF